MLIASIGDRKMYGAFENTCAENYDPKIAEIFEALKSCKKEQKEYFKEFNNYLNIIIMR